MWPREKRGRPLEQAWETLRLNVTNVRISFTNLAAPIPFKTFISLMSQIYYSGLVQSYICVFICIYTIINDFL